MSLLKKIIIQGHRGARGLYPENTILSFIEAVRLGVDTLEMDVVVSKDRQVVVSHEPWMNSAFCTRPDGQPVEENSKEKYNLFNMNYAVIAQYDCGMRGNKEFPQQKATAAHKPLLSDVVAAVEKFVAREDILRVNYNIEIKSEVGDDNIFQPGPVDFVGLVYREMKELDILSHCNLQSFDVRILQEIKKTDPNIVLALLVENAGSLEANLQYLGFVPDIYSPEYILVNDTLVREVHGKGMQIIPWTVNEIDDMKRLSRMGVDGLITDYPDRAVTLVSKKK